MGFKPTPTFVDQQKAPESEQASSLMRSMPVVNNSLHNEKDRNAILPTKSHTKETKQREEKTKNKKTYKVEHKTKSPAQKEAKASEFHPWRLELKLFQVGYPVDTPTGTVPLIRFDQTRWLSVATKKLQHCVCFTHIFDFVVNA